MHPAVANMIGRPDMSESRLSMVGYSNNPAAALSMGAQIGQTNSFNGQLSLGMLAAMVIGLGVFVIWTRKFQA